MSNTVCDSLNLHTLKRLLNLCLIDERLLVDESVQLRLLIVSLDLREYQFYRLEVVAIRNIPDRDDVQALKLFSNLRSFVHFQVVEETVHASVSIDASQVFQKLDEVDLVEGLVEDHESINASIRGNGSNSGQVP